MSVAPAPADTPISARYRAGDLLIDVGVRRVTREGRDLDITGRSFDLLLVLVRTAPNLLSIPEIMARVWPGIIVSPETVIQRIMLLRQGLGDSAESPRYVAAVRGHGYRMTAAVSELISQPAIGIVSPVSAASAAVKDSSAAAPARSWVRRWRTVGAAAVLAVSIGAGGLWWVHEQHGAPPRVAGIAGRPGSFRPPSPAVPRSSVAVMPFANFTGDPASDYVGDGIAEELINTLAQVPGLKVPARTSTFAYKGHNTDVRRIAQELGVATVLEGSVRSTGERLRVGVRLVDAASGFEIWSQDYDRQSPDLFKLQDDLAARVVQALRGYMNVSLAVPAAQPPRTRDEQAYELYLQARSVPLRGPDSGRRAIALLDQALARDPNFAAALAQRAVYRAMPALLGLGSAKLLADADRDAARALALDPNSAYAHATLLMIQSVHWHWLDVEQSYRAVRATSENDPYFRNFHSTFLLRPTGRLRQAESELMVSYHLAPVDGYTLHELIVTESLLGHDAQAVRFSELWHDVFANGAPPVGEDALPYARRALRAGRYAEAAQWTAQALPTSLRETGGREVMQVFGEALADPAKRSAARRALRSLLPRVLTDAEGDRVKMFFVDALTLIGDIDGAHELMARLLDRRLEVNGSGGVDWGEIWAPQMRPFRQDPRFQALVIRVKLPDYWKRYGPPDGCDFKDEQLTCH